MCVQAASQQSPMETLVARFAKWYTPAVVAACLLLIIVPAAMRKHNLKVSNSPTVHIGSCEVIALLPCCTDKQTYRFEHPLLQQQSLAHGCCSVLCTASTATCRSVTSSGGLAACACYVAAASSLQIAPNIL